MFEEQCFLVILSMFQTFDESNLTYWPFAEASYAFTFISFKRACLESTENLKTFIHYKLLNRDNILLK